jgi:RHS repeat-associated protein
LVSDGHRDLRISVEAGGQVGTEHIFDAYGIPLSPPDGNASPVGYTGERSVGPGLLYLRSRVARNYSGRFLGLDTYPGRADDPASLNGFVYTYGNPTQFVDPSGHTGELVEQMAVGTGLVLLALAAGVGYAATMNAASCPVVSIPISISFPNQMEMAAEKEKELDKDNVKPIPPPVKVNRRETTARIPPCCLGSRSRPRRIAPSRSLRGA